MDEQSGTDVPVPARPERLQPSIYLETTANEGLGLLPGEDRAAKRAMVRDVAVAFQRGTGVKEAVWVVKDLGVPVIVVFDGNRLPGVLSDREVALHHHAAGAEEQVTVEGIMRADRSVCHEDDLLSDAASLMRLSNVESLALNRCLYWIGAATW